MKEWKYTLKNGKILREAINEEDYEKILKTLKECYTEILDFFVKEGLTEPENRDDEYEEYIENIDILLGDIDTIEEDDIDYELSLLYDMCDNTNIWIEL